MFLHHEPDAYQSANTALNNINIREKTPGKKREVSSLDNTTPDGSQNANNDVTLDADDVNDGNACRISRLICVYNATWFI